MRIFRHLATIALAILSTFSLPENARALNAFDANRTDIDSDRLDDLVLYNASSGIFTTRSSSTGRIIQRTIPNAPADDRGLVVDLTGDKVSELVSFDRTTARWNVRFFDGSSTTRRLGIVGDIPVPADYNGDGCAELATYNPRLQLWITGGCMNETVTSNYSLPGSEASAVPVPADYDGDGKVDRAIFIRRTNKWVINFSTSNTVGSMGCGLNGDIPVTGDWDGDGRAQPGVFRPDTAKFYKASFPTSGNLCQVTSVTQFGLPGDEPGTGFIDSDNISDLVVYRPKANKYYITTSTGAYFEIKMGEPESNSFSLPIFGGRFYAKRTEGDLNGDNISDISYARLNGEDTRTSWRVSQSNATEKEFIVPGKADAYVAGDYNGDGKIEPAVVYVNSDGNLRWVINDSFNTASVITYGVNGDSPVAGDFDCDGKNDLVVARPTNNGYKNWHFAFSSGTSITNYTFGLSGDYNFGADMNGDGCDEMVLVRKDANYTHYFYRNIFENRDHYISF